MSAAAAHHSSAALIIVGDEILKGQVQDANTYYASRRLYSLGIDLKRVSVIGDFVEELSHLVRQFSESFDYVITSGGESGSPER